MLYFTDYELLVKLNQFLIIRKVFLIILASIMGVLNEKRRNKIIILINNYYFIALKD
jgi:hypothetical protein